MFPVPPPPPFPYHIYAPGFPEDKRDSVMAAYRHEEKAWQRQVDISMIGALILCVALVGAVIVAATVGVRAVFDALMLLAGRQ